MRTIKAPQGNDDGEREAALASRRKAARAGAGAPKDVDFSLDEFLQERREDEERRERALGL